MNEPPLSMQKIINSVREEIIYGGHLLALGASGVIFTTLELLNIPLTISILLIPYLSTQVIYSYNHLREAEFDIVTNPERTSHVNTTRGALIIYLVTLIAALAITNLPTIMFVVSIVISGVLYTDYFKKKMSDLFIGFKSIYSALFWALQVFIIPLYLSLPIDNFYLYLFLILFLTAFINATFFDIKDIESDKERHLKTFPVLWGRKKTLYFLFILKFITFIPLILGIVTLDLPKQSIVFVVSISYGFYYLSQAWFLEGKELRKLSYLIADGEYMLWPLLVILAKLTI